MQRVLFVLEAGDAWPSGYIRGLIYNDLFAQHGLRVSYVNRLVPALEKLLNSRSRMAKVAFTAGAGRVLNWLNRWIARLNERRIVRQARDADVVYLLKTDSYSLVRKLRQTTRARLVFDLNDGLWLPRFAGFADGHLTDILRSVDAVVSDNEYGAAYASTYNQHTCIVPDPAQIELFEGQQHLIRKRPDTVVIGWIGSPGTAFNLFRIWEPLERLFERHSNLQLRLLGVGHSPLLFPRFEHVRLSTLPYYSQAEMVREVLNMDIGLFPLFDIDDSRARGVMKATIYMSGGAAVIASGIGGCNQLITHGDNGMLAVTEQEWFEQLDRLVSDAGLRSRLAERGRELVRGSYRVEHTFEKLMLALQGSPEVRI
jgi:glycosyltransferase involved in cell wall biosynthesis